MDPSVLSLSVFLVGLLQAVVVRGISHGRPPPYAVPMEPLVQYSARDPLYHNPISRSGDVGPEAYPVYVREPEPIIEIIVKESNVTLPPLPPVTQPPPTKEPVHVFYVKYKKDPKSKGGVAYDAPVPAITPPSAPTKLVTQPPIYTAPPLPEFPPSTTTLRTIIRPDSETFHGSGLHVTFGNPHSVESEDRSEEHAAPEQESAPQPALIPPPTPRPQRQTFPNSRPFENPRPKFQPQGFQPLHQPQHVNNFQQPQQHFQQFHPPQSNPKNQFPNPQRVPPLQNQQFTQHFQGPRTPVQPQPNKQSLLNPQQQAQYHQQFNQHQQQLQQFKQNPFPRQQSQAQPPLNQPQATNQHLKFNQQIQNQHQFRQSVPQPQFNNFQRPQQQLHQPQQLHQQTQQHHQQPQQLHQQPQQFQQQPQQLHQQPNQLQQQPQQLHHQPQQFNQQQVAQQTLGSQTHFPQVQHQSPQVKGELIKSVTHFEEHLVQTSKDGKPFGNTGFFQQQQNVQASSPSGIQQNLQQQHFQQNVKHSQPNQQQQINQFQQPVSNVQIPQSHIPNTQQQPLRQFEPQQQQISNAFQQQQKPASSFQQQQTGHAFQQHQQQTTNAFQHQQQKPVSSFQQQQSGSSFQQQASQQTQQQSRHANNQVVSQPQVQLNTQNLLAQQRIVSTTTSTTPATVSSSSPATPESENKKKAAIASLPDEVPSDLREQLLSSGILSNADIQVLDYDKVGDIPIESLPPEALENFYGAGSDPVPSVIKPENVSMGNTSSPVEMKVVRFDSSTPEGRRVAESYIPEGDTATLDTVLLGGAGYSRYLPLTVGGAHFPIPEELKGRNITSVVVLAPVDYKFEPRSGRAEESEAEVDGVRFIGGEALSNVLASPTPENIETWLKQEKDTAPAQQSIILLVAAPKNETDAKEIYMYDIATQRTSKLQGELSATFVRVAEENAGVEAPTSQ